MPRSLPPLLAAILLTVGCAHLPPEDRGDDSLDRARAALHGGEFVTADQLLSRLAARSPPDAVGHEAQFLLGLLYLDPRNPAWNPAEAEHVLGRYLDFPIGERRTEAVVLYSLARRLATPQPPLSSTSGGERPVIVSDSGEAERLRRELEARDRELAKLREELERIRRTLAPSG